jgi:SagB-type dehydrogenase family enzyme
MPNPTPIHPERPIIEEAFSIQERNQLNVPDQEKAVDFFKLLPERRSSRNLHTLTDNVLDSLLWHSAKAKKVIVQDNGYILSQRPYPSAGAIHPIELFVIAQKPVLTFSHYNAFDHSLSRLKVSKKLIEDMVAHLNENVPTNECKVLWMVAFPKRIEAKYQFSDSLLWREAGALLQTLQLTATALNIGSCAFGTLAEPFINKILTGYPVMSCGGLMIGSLDK